MLYTTPFMLSEMCENACYCLYSLFKLNKIIIVVVVIFL